MSDSDKTSNLSTHQNRDRQKSFCSFSLQILAPLAVDARICLDVFAHHRTSREKQLLNCWVLRSEEHNFWDALKGIIRNTTVGTALHTKFEAHGKLPELPWPWQENLLHIGQEALTNTLKYARARNFETRLSYKAKELSLELRDDGHGFRVKERHDGVGLTGMRERVEQMGGELKISSSRGKGTKITVVLPFNGESMS